MKTTSLIVTALVTALGMSAAYAKPLEVTVSTPSAIEHVWTAVKANMVRCYTEGNAVNQSKIVSSYDTVSASGELNLRFTSVMGSGDLLTIVISQDGDKTRIAVTTPARGYKKQVQRLETLIPEWLRGTSTQCPRN